MSTLLPGGWAFPTVTARKMHWFPEGEDGRMRSLCRLYDYWSVVSSELHPEMPKPRFRCQDCARGLETS
jgi:hypothetical protein